MVRLLIAALLVLPLWTSAAPPAEGRIETDEGRIEILGRPVRVGEKVELPEGFIRVEEGGPEDGEVGSFGVIPVESFATPGPGAEAPTGGGPPPPPRVAPPQLCEAERSAYLAELWKMSGIEISDPAALLEGLQGGATGPDAGYYWFAIATDVFRPLAWSYELRSRAEALVRCVRGQ